MVTKNKGILENSGTHLKVRGTRSNSISLHIGDPSPMNIDDFPDINDPNIEKYNKIMKK